MVKAKIKSKKLKPRLPAEGFSIAQESRECNYFGVEMFHRKSKMLFVLATIKGCSMATANGGLPEKCVSCCPIKSREAVNLISLGSSLISIFCNFNLCSSILAKLP